MADASTDDNNGLMLILAYLGPLALIPYFSDEGETDARWHAKQGLTLTGVWIAIWVISNLLAFVPVFGWLLLLLLPFISLALIAIVVVAIVRATNGERWRIPYVADLADRW